MDSEGQRKLHTTQEGKKRYGGKQAHWVAPKRKTQLPKATIPGHGLRGERRGEELD